MDNRIKRRKKVLQCNREDRIVLARVRQVRCTKDARKREKSISKKGPSRPVKTTLSQEFSIEETSNEGIHANKR